MQELDSINGKLGGHQITLKGIKSLLAGCSNKTSLTICEIGCGGGDNLNAISKFCNKNNIAANFIGIDLKTACTTFAKQQYPELNATWIANDYQLVEFNNKPDIIFTSLFCHHFTEVELVHMLQWLKKNAVLGFFINDLHRHLLAYYSIKWVTSLFSKSYLVKNDAPLSVARGFTKTEWLKIFEAAKINKFSINWRWAFRHLIVCKNE